ADGSAHCSPTQVFTQSVLAVQAWPLSRRQTVPTQVLLASQSLESLASQSAPVADGAAHTLPTQVFTHWVLSVQASPSSRRHTVPTQVLFAAQSVESLLSQTSPVVDGAAQRLPTQVFTHCALSEQLS